MQLTTPLSSLPEAASTPVGSEVLRGLASRPRSLSPWLFYDDEGSRLFEAITELPEYYLTRTERAIFTRSADEIVSAAARPSPDAPVSRLTLVELGAGTATKTGLLLDAAVRQQGRVTYQPIDVSASALSEACAHLEAAIPGLDLRPCVADYTEGLGSLLNTPEPIRRHAHGPWPPATPTCRLVLYIGSSIGNFEPAAATRLLRDLRRHLAPGDRLLLGVDMVKDPATLRRAYDDAAGVTAAFNLNVLTRINRELGANFRTRLFRHRARWNEQHARMEMHLESLIAQRISIPALDLELDFAAGETIHTENSYKFTEDGITALLAQGGFTLTRRWTDEQGWFSVCLATAA